MSTIGSIKKPWKANKVDTVYGCVTWTTRAVQTKILKTFIRLLHDGGPLQVNVLAHDGTNESVVQSRRYGNAMVV